MADDRELTPFSRKVRRLDVAHEPLRLTLEPDEAQRRAIARDLKLVDLPALSAEATVTPWADGLQVDARWRARFTQTCGVTLEPFDTEDGGTFQVRAVPPESPHAAAEDSEEEIDLSTPDPPDLMEDGAVDVAALVVEHLALELPLYPRAPGAIYDPPEEDETASPFAALAAMKPVPDA